MSDQLDPPIQTHEYPELLDIQPSSFRVDLLLHTDIFLDLHLTNTTPQLVTFKVKTTARDRYQLKPTQGYIPPHATKQCKIVLSALSHFPDPSNPKAVRDKFLVQSVAVGGGGEVEDLGRFWKEREARHSVKEGRWAYAEQIVKCKLNVPSAAGGGGGGGDSPSRMGVEEREERREDGGHITGGGGGGGGGVIVVDEVKDQQLSGQKQQPAVPATTFTTQQQRLSYPPAITITSTPTQPPQPNTTQHATTSTSSSSSTQQPSFTQSTTTTTSQHDGATYHISSAPTNTNTTATSSSGSSSSSSGSGAGRTTKEYNDLMEFTVRLTAQMEREKADAAIIADKYNKALAHIAQLQKRLAVLTAQQQRDRNASIVSGTGEGGSGGEEEKGNKPLSLSAAAGGGEGGKEEKSVGGVVDKVAGGGGGVGGVGVGMRERLMSGDGVRNNSGGISWQIYQVILVAIIAFVLGRLFSK